MTRRLLTAFAVQLILLAPAQAVPHFKRELYPDAKPCHVKTITPAMIHKFGSPRMAVITPATGTKNVAVLIVRFPSAGATTSGNPTISNPANFNTYITGMNDFFTEASFGIFTLNISFFGSTADADGDPDATTVGSFLMPQPMEYYGCGDVDAGCFAVPAAPAGLGGAYLIRDAISATRTGPPDRSATFDSAAFDAVLVMHAGYGNETTASNGDIWSAFYQEPAVIGSAGGGFVDGATFPELESSGITSPLGVMCHEFGHVLTLPDLYNTAVYGGASVVGDWDLMDSGPYLGNGTNPSHPGAWHKVYLGWASPQLIADRAPEVSLLPIETGTPNSVAKISIHSGSALEYFLVEYRSKTVGLYDRQIPATGLLVWHVDDEITSTRGFSAVTPSLQNTVNTGSPHYGVSIITADGSTISSANQGTASQVYTTGSSMSSPKSDTFSGQPSGISIVSIVAGAGISPATFEVVNLSVTASQIIKKAISYPNPAGKGYAHPMGEGHATIQFHLGRPANDYQINIYTLSGDLVRKVPLSDISLNTERSFNEKWVYEYVWDLKNGNGEFVAPGVYLYLIRADGESKSSKAVIIR